MRRKPNQSKRLPPHPAMRLIEAALRDLEQMVDFATYAIPAEKDRLSWIRREVGMARHYASEWREKGRSFV